MVPREVLCISACGVCDGHLACFVVLCLLRCRCLYVSSNNGCLGLCLASGSGSMILVRSAVSTCPTWPTLKLDTTSIYLYSLIALALLTRSLLNNCNFLGSRSVSRGRWMTDQSTFGFLPISSSVFFICQRLYGLN